MFSLFKKKEAPLIAAENRIWMNKKVRFAGIYQHFSEAQATQLVILITFFPDTASEIETLVKTSEKSFKKIELTSDLQATENIWLITSENFLTYGEEIKKVLAKRNFTVIFPEHYPISAEEDKILRIISDITFKTKVTFYADLDEEFFKLFGGERIKEMMIKLGLKEEETVSHNMVSKSLRNAQQKIAEHTKIDQKSRSQAEWFSKNYIK
jgi:hypothetical protein